jgi:flagellar hook-associated protein 2
MALTSAGIGSGLDVNGLVSKLMSVEQAPLLALDKKEATYQSKISAYGALKASASSLQSAALALKSTSLYNGMSASSSATSVVSASASTAATAATYSLEVLKKAQAQSIASQAFSSLTTDIAVADGKLKIELGTYTAQVGTAQVGTAQVGTAQVGTAEVGVFGDPGYVAASVDYAPASVDYVPASADYAAASADYVAASFTANADKTPVTIPITATTSSISDIRDAINANNAGVKASLVYVGAEGYKLSLTSTTTGAAYSIKMTALDSSSVPLATDNTGLAKLSFNPLATTGTGKEFAVSVAAQDAELTINGIAITRSSNTISDAITGVTLTVGATGTSTLTLAKNTSSVSSALDTFVKAYNDLSSQLTSLTKYDTQNKTPSLLTGDSAARGLQSALRDMIAYRRPVVGSPYSTLSDLGVAMQRDGTLTFNTAKLATAAAASTTDMLTLFTSDSKTSPGLAIKASATIDGLLKTNGLISSHIDGINKSIADIGNRRTTLNRRLLDIEKRYRTQFSSLDTLVASMQQTSSYLTQQLANLPSST